jgi:hypothetical protein
MADADVAITAGAGTKIDTRTVGAGTDEHRQVMVVGDPVTAANVALVTAAGGLLVTDARPATSTLANVASSATNVTLRASNTARLGLMLYNDSTSSCYVKFGATASATSFTVFMGPTAYYELPNPCYSGIVDGVWIVANGNMRVTELTA